MTRPRNRAYSVLMYAFLIFLLLLSIVPFYLVLVNATHSSFDIVTQLNLLPGSATGENYATMQSHLNIWRGFANSLIIALPYTLLTATSAPSRPTALPSSASGAGASSTASCSPR